MHLLLAWFGGVHLLGEAEIGVWFGGVALVVVEGRVASFVLFVSFLFSVWLF